MNASLRLRCIAVAVLLLCATADSEAGVGGTISLAHNDCLVDGGLQSRDTDCVTSNFSHFMVVAFSVDTPLPSYVGSEIVLDMIDDTNPSAIGDWWQWDAAGCRSGGLTPLFDPTLNPDFSGASCEDVFANSSFGPSGGVGRIERPSTGTGLPANSQRVIIGVVVRSDDPLSLGAGTQYVPTTLRARATSTQTAACPGCSNAIVMSVNSIFLGQLPGSPGGDPTLSTPDPFAANGSCITFNQPSSACAAGTTPNHLRTWGQVKSLYR